MKEKSRILNRENFKSIREDLGKIIVANVEGKKQKIEIVVRNMKTPSEKREVIQNALMWHWNGEEANFNNIRDSHLGKEYTPKDIHRINKLDYGIPILCRDPSFMAMWLQFKYHTRPAKIAMLKYIPVTSIMTLEQMAEYLTTIKTDKENNGCVLTDSHDMEQEALGRGKRK